MTLQQLKYIIAVSKYMSISAAAQALGISQPTLSTAIKDLEEEFQTTMLCRNHRGVSFTPDGLEFLRFAGSIIKQTEQLHRRFHIDQDKGRMVRLTVSSQHYPFAADALIQIVNELSSASPYIVTLREVRTAQVIQDVRSRQSQIGILFLSRQSYSYMTSVFANHELEFTGICRCSPHVYLSASHPLAHLPAIAPSQLKGYPYVRFDQQSDADSLAEELFLPDIPAKQLIQITDRATLFSMICRTTAYTIGTGCVSPALADASLRIIPVSAPADRMTIGWICRKDAVLTPELQQYIRYLTDCLSAMHTD